jgi:hypothetical protein
MRPLQIGRDARPVSQQHEREGDGMFGRWVRRALRLPQILGRFEQLEYQGEAQLLLLGKQLSHTVKGLPDGASLRDAEFRVFSQFGDDGIIQYLLSAVPVSCDCFIEFGVEDYREATTRFLMHNDNWRGLVMDSSEDSITRIRQSWWYGLHELTVRKAWVTAENVNDHLADAGFAGPVGLLHIDIDGNDLHVWNAIDVVDPDIVILEYNALLGPDHSLTLPYDPAFDRTVAHSSWLYFGSSLRALADACAARDYAFVGCNSAGNNAYFVRRGKLGRVREVSIEEGFVMSRFRESRDNDGQFTFVSGADRLALMRDAVFLDLERDALRTVGEIYGV